MEKLKELLASRKFWAAFIGLGMVILKAYKPDFPLTEDQLVGVIGVVVAYILGVGLENVAG